MADETEDEGRDNSTVAPTILDASSHAELCMLYRESTETLRFAKNLQWRTVGATMMVYGSLIAIAAVTGANLAMPNKLMAITLLLTVGSLFTLVVYQFWQYNETAKINSMNGRFSSIFETTRGQRSKLEGNIHRYLLLVFMMTTLVLGAVVTNLALTRIAVT